jgi:hypothetical protein
MTAVLRQYILLGALVTILGGTLAFQLSGDDTAGTTPRPSNQASRRAADAKDALALETVVDVGIERLSAERDALQPVERNPFRFRPRPAPPPPPPTRVVPRPVTAVAPPAPAGPPPPPPIPLRYIGFAEPERSPAGPVVRFGVFSDGKGMVANAKEGDILEGRYRVLRVGTDSAELVYLDGRGRQTITLKGQ